MGRKKCRTSYFSRSTTKATRCNFFFYINFDAADAKIQNIVFNKTGKLVPRHTICQIIKYKRMIVNDSDFIEMFSIV